MHVDLRMGIRTLSPFSAMDQVDSPKSSSAELADVVEEQFGEREQKTNRRGEERSMWLVPALDQLLK